ncbi:hypothetical protein UPYG_G00030510 [Umbra pygmaea]|uniref:Uncharacterized protein n=1 Tax=Umbra pygmaea TaxID=75934 RepID=A0ABD0XPM4_UMBPY
MPTTRNYARHILRQISLRSKKGKTKADAIPSILAHRSKVKKIRTLPPRDNLAPVNLAQINTEHSYTAKDDTVISQKKKYWQLTFFNGCNQAPPRAPSLFNILSVVMEAVGLPIFTPVSLITAQTLSTDTHARRSW